MSRDTDEEEVLDLPPDLELEAPFSASEITPTAFVCPDCGGDAVQLDDDIQPPALPSEAWRFPTCRGTRDASKWRWCREIGELTLPSQEGMRVLMERRKVKR